MIPAHSMTTRSPGPPVRHDRMPLNPPITVPARGQFIRVRSANRPVRNRATSLAVLAEPLVQLPARPALSHLHCLARRPAQRPD